MKSFCKSLVTLTFAVIATLAALAQDVPSITKYYPDHRPDDPMYLNTNTKAYTYFTTGSKVLYSRARIVQNGQTLGTCIYRSSTPAAVTTMNPALAENSDLNNLSAGVFNLEVYEICYMSGNEEVVYTSEDEPLGIVTYRRNVPNGTIVEEIGHADRLIKSYYPAGGEDGFKRYVFSKSVKPDAINAYFSYGIGDNMYNTDLPWDLSEDGLTLTVDFRGNCYSGDVLAPGVIFYDVDGTPLPPPTTIVVVVNNLVCVDGSMIDSESVSLDGNFKTTLQGKIHQVYHYEDLTFPTPQIDKVEFVESEGADQRYAEINENTDLMLVTVSNNEYISEADLKIVSGANNILFPIADLEIAGDIYFVNIPEAIRTSGNKSMTISLENVVFTVEDGVEHVIKPYLIGDEPTEAYCIADLENFPHNQEVVLNVTGNGVTVTLAKAGYIFMEDNTGGIQVITSDFNTGFTVGSLIKGRLVGTYAGSGVFMVNESKCEYTDTPVDVSTGYVAENIDDVIDGTYDNRLVTFNASSVSIAYDEETQVAIIGNKVLLTTDLIENPYIPETFVTVTGVLYNDPNSANYLLIARSQDDINNGEIDAIDSVNSDSREDADVYNLNGVRIDAGNMPSGVYISAGRKFIKR